MPPKYSEFTTLDQFLQALVDYEELLDRANERLHAVGLDVAHVIAGMREVDEERSLAPSDVEATSRDRTAFPTGVMEGPRARHWVTVWWAHGLSIEQIAILVGREPAQHSALVAEIDAYVINRPNVLDERQVLDLHRLGLTPLEISRRTGMVRQTVHNVLVRCGVTPHARQRRAPDEIRNKVIADRNRGMAYPDLRKKYALTTNQVRSILRYAARQGLVKDYGKGEGVAS